jgi:O-acetyl-ADP-ribose deacetylase (regulator of RNase III)
MKIVSGDILKKEGEGILSLVDENLRPVGNVTKPIIEAAGSKIIEELNTIKNEKGSIAEGEVFSTSGGDLVEKGLKHIIHIVAVKETNEEVFEKAMNDAFEKAVELEIKTIIVPDILCGEYNFDKFIGSDIVCKSAKDYDRKFDSMIMHSNDADIVDNWINLVGFKA